MPDLKPRQENFLSWRLGLFIHFGPYTWYPYENFSYESIIEEAPADYTLFNPDQLDCTQWAQVAKSSGFGHMLLTVKHQDGFCLWPTQTASPAVNKIAWANGQRDIVQEYVDACRAAGLKVGFYYSLYNINGINDDLGHLEELLSNYGTVDYLFFDGYGVENAPHDYAAIGALIRRLQPNIILSNGMAEQVLIFGDGDPDVGWIGNEDGIPTVELPYYATYLTRGNTPTWSKRVIIPSAYVRIRDKYWFYDNSGRDPLKKVSDLVTIYDNIYEKGQALCINVAPDRHGVITSAESNLLSEFKAQIGAE